MSGALLSLMGWSFLPGLVTGWVQTIYYAITVRAGDPKPRPGSPRHAAHRRRIQLLVVGAYLLYTIFEADREVCRATPSFYAELGVPFDASDRDVKSRFRRLASLHHPDKAGQDGAAYFMYLKTASDTLTDAARRFAYERLGPDALAWRNKATVRDYVVAGVFQGILPHYGLAAAVVYGMGWLGYLTFGRYERWVMMLSLCVFELYLVTRPFVPAPLAYLNGVLAVVWPAHPAVLPFQAVALCRRLAVTVYIAISQMGPLLLRADGAAAGRDAEERALREGLDRLDAAAGMVDAEATRLWEMELAPYAGDAEVLTGLRGKMGEWLVQNTIRADPMVRDSLGSSFRRRRMDVPAGAKGTK